MAVAGAPAVGRPSGRAAGSTVSRRSGAADCSDDGSASELTVSMTGASSCPWRGRPPERPHVVVGPVAAYRPDLPLYWLWVGFCVGLVIEHPDSSAARVTAPSSFAAPAQLGCGSLRRRWEAQALPRSGSRSQRSLVAVEHRRTSNNGLSRRCVHRGRAPRHLNQSQYPTCPAPPVHRRDDSGLEAGSSRPGVATLSVPCRRRVNRMSVGRKSGASRLRAATTSSGLTSGAE